MEEGVLRIGAGAWSTKRQGSTESKSSIRRFKMRRNPTRFPPNALLAWPLQLPKDDWDDTIPLDDFLSGKCPHHEFGCGDATAHCREFKAHADAYDAVDGSRQLRHEPLVGFGATGGRHVIYWKLDQNGQTYRSGHVRDLVRFDDYAPEA
jgi:hypothetical protein